MVSSLQSSLGTERKVVTELPGPKSRALHERRRAVVSAGLTNGFPVYIERGEGAILLDVDGNRLLDLGSGIAVVSIGHAVPELIEAVSAQVAAFTHTCFMVTPYESYVEVCEELAALTPGDARQDHRSVQLRRGGRGERRQGGAPRHRPGRGGGLRPRLPRSHEPHDGPDREEHALQGPLRALRPRGLPRRDELPLPRRPLGRGGGGPGHQRDRDPGRRAATSRRCSSSPSRARAASWCRPRASSRRSRSGRRGTASSSSPTRSRAAFAARATGSPSITRAWCPTSSPPPRASRGACRSRR